MEAGYVVVKWSPDHPETKELAVEKVFTDREMAETVKTRLQGFLPYCCFAVEPIIPGKAATRA